jgi:hypothetical protein
MVSAVRWGSREDRRAMVAGLGLREPARVTASMMARWRSEKTEGGER